MSEPDFTAIVQARRWVERHSDPEVMKADYKAAIQVCRNEDRALQDRFSDMDSIPQQIREGLDSYAEKLLISDFTRSFKPRLKKIEGEIEKLQEFAQVAKGAKRERERFEANLPAHELRALQAGRAHARLAKERLITETMDRLNRRAEEACKHPIRQVNRHIMESPVMGKNELQQLCQRAVKDGFQYVFGA